VLAVVLRVGVLGVDRAGERAQAEERLAAIELARALALVELVHDRRVVQPRDVAPVLLGPVQGRVGAAQRLVGAAGRLEVAEADRDRRAHPQQRGLGHSTPRAVGHEQRPVAIALDEDRPELVAADAGEHVLLADRVAQQRGDLAEDLVGHLHARSFAEVAEAVDVDQGDGQRPPVALRACDLAGQP
jgi:hypothetical protein